jgi:hypothetical protein
MINENNEFYSKKMTQESEHGAIRSRILALLEVSAIFAIVMLLFKGHMNLPSLAKWQSSVLGRPFIRSIACLVVFPLFVIRLTKLDSSLLSPSRSDFFRSCLIGLIPMVVLFPVGSTFWLLHILNISWLSWRGAVILTVAYGIAVPFVALVLRGRPSVPDYGLHARELVMFAGLLLVAILLSSVTLRTCPIIGKVLYSFLFVGVAEELLARGYFQTRLNKAFGRPFRFLGIQFGWGLIIASGLFGLMHYFSPGNAFHIPWAVWVTTSSLIFGMVREKGGSFIASGITHGAMLLPKVLFAG